MTPETEPVLRIAGPARCVIRVRGALAANWSEQMGDLRITGLRDGRQSVTELSGRLSDQAALHGVLNALYELGFPLLSVECEADPEFAG